MGTAVMVAMVGAFANGDPNKDCSEGNGGSETITITKQFNLCGDRSTLPMSRRLSSSSGIWSAAL
ncbi:hypothetical protein AAVH_23203 [Aphelenchoides avenae]|nr:hypothetical protein AAVH_23203 [Aphelenchus avenae]